MKKSPAWDEGSLTVVGGTVTDLKSTDGGQTWTGTFTPPPGYTGSASVPGKQRQLPDLNGNVGTGNSDDTAIDPQAPSVEVNIVDDLLSVGETSEVTFSFSEKVTGFDEGSLNRSGRHRHRSQEHRRRSTWTGNLHPDPGLKPGSPKRDREQRQLHRSQRQRGTGNSDDTAIDTQAPSVEVNIV
ncbi:Ig-like domain-containing protein [Aeromonas veronii]|uniref:Ig-like domain-containing protein n=1 Tax=Aeromonas veronii TaxID=654 RepID=UPI00200048F8|nr:Ig-like domain-containing protein [Aeromonas veronii]UPK54799.1 Ig-like domain-containing protein [Aeromonas veronii]